MGCVIAFSGMDCSGKSTQIGRLRSKLEARNEAVSVLWHRPGYSSGLDRLRGAVRRLRPSALPTLHSPSDRERVFGRPWVRRLWAAAAVADMAWHYGVHVRRAAVRSTVICDRYTYDGLVDLSLRFPELGVPNWHLSRWMLRVVPKPTLHFALVVSRETLEKRAAAKNEPFPDTLGVREKRFARYEEWTGTDRGVRVIDAGRTEEEVFQEIWALVSRERGYARPGND